MSEAFQPIEPEPPKKKKSKKEEPPTVSEFSLRGALRDAIGGDPKRLDFIAHTLWEACQPTLRVKIPKSEPCPRCNCPHERYVMIPRYKEAVELGMKVMDQIEGKPGTAEAGSQGVVVNWAIKGLDEE